MKKTHLRLTIPRAAYMAGFRNRAKSQKALNVNRRKLAVLAKGAA